MQGPVSSSMMTPPSVAAPERPPLVVLNPASRHGRRVRAHIERALREKSGELVVTSGPSEAERLAVQAATDGRGVIAVGGDGTVAEVANGILSSGQQVPLGIVPAGNGNDYAYRTLMLPTKLDEAIEMAFRAPAQAMDIGQAAGRYFINDLGVGIDANIAAAAEGLKRVPFLRGGRLYYTASLDQLLFHYANCPDLLVTCDGQVDARRTYALAAVSIGPTYGGGFRINPTADPRDGLFDVCLVWKPSLLRALRILPKIQRGQHLDLPEVRHLRAKHILIEALRPIYAHSDGEVVTGERFEVRVLPGALLVRQPLR